MNRIYELQQERQKLLEKQNKIVATALKERRNQTHTEGELYDEYERRLNEIDTNLITLQREERESLRLAKNTPTIYPDGRGGLTSESFKEWLNRAIEGGTEPYKIEFRADPILTTTNSNILNKTVNATHIAITPSEQLISDLGIQLIKNVNGSYILPSLTQDMATFVAEDVSAASADMGIDSLTLTPMRVTHTQSITRETLEQTTDVLKAVIENLYAGIWNAVVAKLFDEIDTDAATQICNISGTVSFNDIVNLEASVGAYELTNPAYVMLPQTKAYLKKTAALTNQEAIWKNGTVNEYKATTSPYVNNERIYFGDWSKAVIVSGGEGIEIIADPYTGSSQGRLKLTAVGTFDCGIINKRVFSIIGDASTF